MWTLTTTTNPTARTFHFCSDCGALIYPGHPYRRTEGLCAGTWRTHKHCGRCECLEGDQFLRPEDAIERAHEAAEDPDRWPLVWFEEGAFIMDGLESYGDAMEAAPVQREAVMLPRTGLLEWEERP